MRVDVREVSPYGAQTMFIDCIRNCYRPLHYKELVGTSLLSMTILNDNTDHIFMNWVGGSAYHIYVYKIDANGVSKIFEHSSRGAGQYYIDEKGTETIISYDRGLADKPGRVFQQTWLWDGHSFRKGKRLRLH